ncbi:MAG: TMEM165/GDT1 family protein [Burkholderiales bacterium]|nr:TMEM165/GDT1 family protein [Burkholderiales bacterium]
MEALLISTGIIALAEIGDKTQLLAFLLASRYKQTWPIVFGIFVATIFNHTFAGLAGAWVAQLISPTTLKIILAISFIAMGIWILIPDKMEDDALKEKKKGRYGVFGLTFVTFFLAEMGDKTQLATVALAAQYGTPFIVIMGTTLGMLIADVPAVWVGDKLAEKIPVKWVRIVSAAAFVIIGVLIALDYGPELS